MRCGDDKLCMRCLPCGVVKICCVKLCMLFAQDRDKLREEMSVMKEAFQLSKTRFDSQEQDSKVHRAEAERLREVGDV